MTNESQTKATPEEEAFERLLNEKGDSLSKPARDLLVEAYWTARVAHMIRSRCYQPEEYEEAMENMRSAGAEVTDHDLKLLSEIWRAALSAAASIDPEDFETPAGPLAYRGNLHCHYRMLSGMVEEIWLERTLEFRRRRQNRRQETSEITSPSTVKQQSTPDLKYLVDRGEA